MKSYILSSLFICFVLCFAPLVTLSVNKQPDTVQINVNETSEDFLDSVRVLKTTSGNVISVDLTEYLIGAVACEMPASFNKEALKAQAVASYTYLRWITSNADNPQQAIYDISDDSNTHQGYMNKSQLQERWGKKYTAHYQKIKEAVESVENEYISYENEPINAVFHGMSHGKTNNSRDIWNTDIPYLISVEAPGDKLSSDLVSEVTLSETDFLNAVNVKADKTKQLITVTEKRDDGYIKELKIGSEVFNATEVRSILSLESPNFTVKENENSVTFTVYGKGHGLGMSQYSADFMARQGSDYKEILYHFYPDTKIVKD